MAVSTAEANKAFILKYFDRVINQHDADAIPASHDTSYRQHSPTLPDGVDGLIEAYAKVLRQYPRLSGEVKRVVAEGDLVVIHSHCRFAPEDRGAAVVDIFRVSQGRIVEHWDVVQPIPETASNSNGMF